MGCSCTSADVACVTATSDAARLPKIALLAASNVNARNGHCGSIQVACQYALVSHGCMSSCVDQRVGLHSKAKAYILPCQDMHDKSVEAAQLCSLSPLATLLLMCHTHGYHD